MHSSIGNYVGQMMFNVHKCYVMLLGAKYMHESYILGRVQLIWVF